MTGVILIPFFIFFGAPMYFYTWSNYPGNKQYSIGRVFLIIWVIDFILLALYIVSFRWYSEGNSGVPGILDTIILIFALLPVFMIALLAVWHKIYPQDTNQSILNNSNINSESSLTAGWVKTVVLLLYILLLISFFVNVAASIIAVPAIIMIIVLQMKKNIYQNTWLTSHVKWLTISLFTGLFISIIGLSILFRYQIIGFTFFAISALWLEYRSIKGLYYFNKTSSIGKW